jgi:hypothetical protein
LLLEGAKTATDTQAIEKEGAMSKYAKVEITERFVLSIESTGGDFGQIKACADLNRIGAQLLHDALSEYLGLTAKSFRRGRTTMFGGEDLTEHPVKRKSYPVKLHAPPGGVVRLDRGSK